MKRTFAALVAILLFVSCRKVEKATGNTIGSTGILFKIGVALDIGGLGDKAFNDSAYEGMKRLAETYRGFIAEDNVNFGFVLQIRYIETKTEGRDREQIVNFLARNGYDLVIGIGSTYVDAVLVAAKNNPDTHFAVIDGLIPNLDTSSNITCVTFADHEGAFMAGAVAGYLTRDDPKERVGFMGGTNNPVVNRYRVGYYAGAAYTNPGLLPSGFVTKFVSNDITGFNDPDAAYAAAYEVFTRGAGIVFQACGRSGAGVFKAAYENDCLAIGSEVDQATAFAASEDPEQVRYAGVIATSMVKRIDRAVFMLGKELMEWKSMRGGYRLFKLADGGVDYVLNDTNAVRLRAYVSELDALKRAIVEGVVTVPENDDQLKGFYEDVLTGRFTGQLGQ